VLLTNVKIYPLISLPYRDDVELRQSTSLNAGGHRRAPFASLHAVKQAVGRRSGLDANQLPFFKSFVIDLDPFRLLQL
jgi:hypothetical protein